MLENPWRRLALVLFLVGLGSFFLVKDGLKLGLDLQGGTRLVYRVDIEAAKADGNVRSDEDPQKIMADVMTVIGKRIDPQGVKDPSITQAGSENILIELPGSDKADADQIQARIEDLGALEMRIVAYPDYEGLPDGEHYDLAAEKKRLDAWLAKDENRKLVDADPLAAIEKFNSLTGEEGPKSRYLRWAPMYRKQIVDDKTGKKQWFYARHSEAYPDGSDPTKPSFMPLNMHDPRSFTGKDLDAKQIMPTTDSSTGQPALAYEIDPSRANDYGTLSEDNIQKAKAILLNHYVRLAPVFQSAIYGRGQISGGFTQKEIQDLVIVLKTGSLRIVPELESRTTIGPSLGQAAIDTGRISIVTGGALIVLFMLLYYRVAGIIAIIGLAANVALIFGSLAFMRATLTLPGLAGIVLTIGMAVDANILIFERIREEKDKGKDLLRAIEAGFEKAMSTILDANITTFLTGLILYNVGVGPIRGFAVTLMLGIVASVFCAVFIGRLGFHFLMAKGTRQELSMNRLFTTPNLRLLRVRRVTSIMSLTLVIGSLIAFFVTNPNDKYGLDFTGGAAVQVALRAPTSQADMLKTLRADSEFAKEFPNPQITTLSQGGARTTTGKSSAFLIKLKLTPEQRVAFAKAQEEAKQHDKSYAPPYIGQLQRLLGERLANEPFSDIFYDSFETKSIFACTLHAIEPLDVATVRKQLETAWTIDVCNGLGPDGKPNDKLEQARDIRIEGESTPFKPSEQGRRLRALPTQLRDVLRKMDLGEGKALSLSSPFPESSLIGSRAVGDLRGRAIGAMLLSLLIIVMYIRIRFHEYKYGIAACIALIHDLCISLGAIVVFHRLGLIHAEIDLSMIAAFLTIIGYSLNDTIVVFDRIRENVEDQKKLGGKQGFEQLVDMSVNQTLSRTMLTSITTFLVVLALFVFNYGAGSVLEGFAFSMMVGIIVGTYSSIWVANPVVLWFTQREKPVASDHGQSITHPDPKVPEPI